MSQQPKKYQINELIRQIDLFGHPVNLNYHKDEQKRKTFAGGACSLLIIMFMLGYVLATLQKIHDWQYNNLWSNEGRLKLDQLGEIPLDDLEFQYFHVIRKPNQSLVNAQEIDRYIHINYMQSEKFIKDGQ